jgi:sec-independent protein translocase protein TatC
MIDIDPDKKKPAEHLEDLRRTIIWSLGAVALTTAAAWFFSDRFVEWLSEPARRFSDAPLYFFSPADALMVRINAALLVGIIAASPVIAYQVWSFVAPALYSGEKHAVLPWALATGVLFAIGCAFGYFFILPTTLQFTLSYATPYLQPMLSIKEYMAFAGDLVLAAGVAFDFPVLIVGLVASGFVKTATLAKFRRHAYVVIFVVAAVLTPPDVASQFLLGIPMLVLFEASMLVAYFLDRSRKTSV